jgi:FMN phosphatase YigB (HAD superfamily)
MDDWKPSLVLFDLGGVLFEFRHAEIFGGMRSAPLAADEMDEFWEDRKNKLRFPPPPILGITTTRPPPRLRGPFRGLRL